jgi:hypothetical protein
MFTKKFVRAKFVWVDDVNKGVSILGKRSCKDNKLPVLMHSLQELRDPRPNQNKDVAYVSFNLNWKNNVWILYGFEGRVD